MNPFEQEKELERLLVRVTLLEADAEQRERQMMALQKNLERAAQSLLSAAKAEKRPRGKLPS